ncbi:MAG TPA: HDIG domain-containing protein [Pseudogracilibacillus sp.]|nr:HDIG domain-containing protein [Pseudogracilibacillus sp.]
MKRWMKSLFSIFNFKTESSKWITVIFPALLLGVFFYLISFSHMYSKTYDIERFNRADETIRSPITIEDEVETDRIMRETVQSVSDRYAIVDDITEEQITYLEEIFDAVDKIYEENEIKKEEKTESDKDKDEDLSPLSNEEMVYELKEVLSSEITDNIDDVFFMQLFEMDEKERNKGKELYIKTVKKILKEGVRAENIESAKDELKNTLKFSSLGEEEKDAFGKLISFSIVENSIYDVEKTMEARRTAASKVEPVVIQSGDIIVREGQIITNELYEDLKLVGLLNKERSVFPAIGLAILMLFITSTIAYELYRLYKRNQLDRGKVLSILFISVITATFMKVISYFYDPLNPLYLLAPIATGVLLIKMLIFERLSIIMAVVYAILGSILFNGQIPSSLNMEAFIYFLFFQFAGIYLLTNVRDRVIIVKVAFGMALINIMMIFMFIFFSFEKFALKSLLIHSSYGVGAAILAAILTIGLLPFFETGLGILSDSKLLALANPNQKLIKKILTEAPGTYHHSVMVANLSESACEAIGANGLLARVGSYYHDIGKTVNPQYFIENQVAIKNPHDFISAKESAKIIISHVTDGVRMLKEHNLPKEIIDICEQHHGTSLVEYFYRTEVNNNPDTTVDKADFRYPGPKPLTKEAGIISICDSVEAAVRSLKEPSTEKIEEIIDAIINSKLTDGQLDYTPLTLEELHLIRNTVVEALKGIFHSRIEYPDEEE